MLGDKLGALLEMRKWRRSLSSVADFASVNTMLGFLQVDHS